MVHAWGGRDEKELRDRMRKKADEAAEVWWRSRINKDYDMYPAPNEDAMKRSWGKMKIMPPHKHFFQHCVCVSRASVFFFFLVSVLVQLPLSI